MIKKFKTFEEARRDLWVEKPDAEYYKRLDSFYFMAYKMLDMRSGYEPGVYKFKTIEEADKDRKEKRMAYLLSKNKDFPGQK
ncbi:MAG: hypothetical protein AMXMBFR48_11950 [Ignavibacteriales bacterium]